jgi:hypothetical protein
MKHFIFLFLLVFIAACNNDNKSSTSNSEKKQPIQDLLVDSASNPIISQIVLSRVGLYFGSDRSLLGMGCELVSGITKKDQITELLKFQKRVINLNRTQDIKWFMGERSHMIFESYFSFTSNEIEVAIENALIKLASDGCQRILAEAPDSAVFKKFKYFETRTKYKTNHCFSKVENSLNETYLVALDSQDSKQNIYYSTSTNLASCQSSLSMNVSPVHRFFANADTYSQFDCYKNAFISSAVYLLKEIRTKDENELLELIIINRFDNAELCQDEKVRQ